MSDLYVMQNHVGLIKIGRSVSVEARCKAIESSHGCNIKLVAVFQGAGAREDEIHRALDEYRRLGEWFDGIDQARQAVIIEVGLDPETVWPIKLADNETVDGWLDALSERMHLTTRNKEVQKVIRELANSEPGVPDANYRWEEARIFTTYWRFIRAQKSGVSVGRDDQGVTTYVGIRFGGDEEAIEEPVPPYLTQIDAALSLWPDADRPSSWQGSVRDCSIAALKAQKARLATSIG